MNPSVLPDDLLVESACLLSLADTFRRLVLTKVCEDQRRLEPVPFATAGHAAMALTTRTTVQAVALRGQSRTTGTCRVLHLPQASLGRRRASARGVVGWHPRERSDVAALDALDPWGMDDLLPGSSPRQQFMTR